MEQKKRLRLTGYFDSNFGDDLMMRLIVTSLPDVKFEVEKNTPTPILSEPNVTVRAEKDTSTPPLLTITGSGFMINNSAALKTELLWCLKGHRDGDYCLGCNIEPLDSPIKRFLIKRRLNGFQLITCRDTFSYQWLCKNTHRPEIFYFPDILFSIPDEWIPSQKASKKLGISLMHRAGDSEECEYYRIMARMADEWICRTGRGVILMAFDSGTEDDLFSCLAVRSLMRYPEQAEIVAHKEGTEIFSAFSECEKIIGARFHSIVLALRMGIPVYPLIFREKARNLLKDLQFPYHCSDLDRIDTESLESFLEKPQTPFLVKKEILQQASEHALALKRHLER